MVPEVGRETAALIQILEHHGVTVVLDVGANVGQYGTRLRRAGWDGRIVSFEPLPGAHAALTAAAAGDPSWHVAAPVALGDRDGSVTLNQAAESDRSSVLPLRPCIAGLPAWGSAGLATAPAGGAREGAGTITVEAARLDNLFDRHVGPQDRAFLRIDTQGYELPVLRGATAVLPRLAGIQIALSLVPLRQGEPDWLASVHHMTGLGMQPVLFIPGDFDGHAARLVAMDGVFVRNPGFGGAGFGGAG
jgi:FkbM family methyltransferase